MDGFDPTSTRLGRDIPMRGPTDGAMISPYGAKRKLSRDEARALLELGRAQNLARALCTSLNAIAAHDWQASDALQDAMGWAQAIRDTELPATLRAIADKED